jgi:hypothetical protein
MLVIFKIRLLLSFCLYEQVKTKIIRTTILPVVLRGRETSALTIRKEHGMKVFENRMLDLRDRK